MAIDHLSLVHRNIFEYIKTHMYQYIGYECPPELIYKSSSIIYKKLSEMPFWDAFNQNEITFRRGNYALAMYNDIIKIKIFVGYNAFLARENRKRSKHLYHTEYQSFGVHGCLVEIHEWDQNVVLADIFRDCRHANKYTDIITQETLTDLVSNFVCKPLRRGNLFYTRDPKAENMVYDAQTQELYCIDYDYVLKTDFNWYYKFIPEFIISDFFEQESHINKKLHTLDRELMLTEVKKRLANEYKKITRRNRKHTNVHNDTKK